MESRCQPYQDSTDLFTALGWGQKGDVRPQAFKPLITVLPVVASNPTQGALAGVAAILGIYLGDPETTTISNINANILYTTKNQFLSGINSVLMLEGNEWQFQGDWRFLIFNQDTFGLGTGPTPVSGGFTLNGYGTTAAVEGAQPMDLNLIRIRENVLKKVWGPLYVGPGFSFDRYYGIRDLSLDLAASPAVVTSHYAYSKVYGFPTGAYNTSGLSLNVIWDSRDSTINPYRGTYASLSYQWNPTFLGSTDGQLAPHRRIPDVHRALQGGPSKRAGHLGLRPDHGQWSSALSGAPGDRLGFEEPDRTGIRPGPLPRDGGDLRRGRVALPHHRQRPPGRGGVRQRRDVLPRDGRLPGLPRQGNEPLPVPATRPGASAFD